MTPVDNVSSQRDENNKNDLQNWQDELNSATMYRHLAELESDPRLADVYRRIAETEIRHSEKFAERIKAAVGSIPSFKPSLRTRILMMLARRLGPAAVLPSILSMEQKGSDTYLKQMETPAMAGEEQSHARLVSQISRTSSGGMTGGALALLEGRHRGTGNALRAAVLGANDGLVSNLSLVMGVAGATMEGRTILITGLAGMLAGAISMALGEWLSVQSSRELFANQVRIETEEIEQSPDEEVEELALIYEARGLNKEQATLLSTQIMSDRESAVQTLAREELGIDPEELGGSAWEAALTSFFLFLIGAVIPVVSFTFLTGLNAVLLSIGLSVLGLFVLGAVITLFTGQKVLYSGMRMVIFGLMAAAVTFGIGRIIGVSIGG